MSNSSCRGLLSIDPQPANMLRVTMLRLTTEEGSFDGSSSRRCVLDHDDACPKEAMPLLEPKSDIMMRYRLDSRDACRWFLDL